MDNLDWKDWSSLEVIDYVTNHLLSQGCRSKSLEAHGCAYRGPSGRKCAAGCLIPDSLYTTEMENKSWGVIIEDYPILCSKHSGLIEKLQYIHDGYPEPVWPSLLKKLRLNYESWEK